MYKIVFVWIYGIRIFIVIGILKETVLWASLLEEIEQIFW